MKDINGNILEKGSIVAYSVTVFQRSELRIGVIQNIIEKNNKASIKGYNYNPINDSWSLTKGSISNANAKCLIIPPGLIPNDIHGKILNDVVSLVQ